MVMVEIRVLLIILAYGDSGVQIRTPFKWKKWR